MRVIKASWHSPRPWVQALGVWMAVGVLLWTAPESTLGAPPNAKPWTAPRRAARKKNPIPADAQSIQAGKNVYLRECVSCHGADGRGKGAKAAELDVPPGDLTAPAMWEQSDGSLYWKIANGRAPMPAFKTLLTDEQRWNVLNYMHTFAPSADTVIPPKFDVPKPYRKALSELLASYLKAQAVLAKEQYTEAHAHFETLASAVDELKRLKTEDLSKEALRQWSHDVGAIVERIEALAASEDCPSMRKSFSDLSKALADAVGHFGHTEKTPLRLFASTTKYRGKPALWLQIGRHPTSPYGAPAHADDGPTLKKTLGTQRTPTVKGGAP